MLSAGRLSRARSLRAQGRHRCVRIGSCVTGGADVRKEEREKKEMKEKDEEGGR